jgi:hypothetical protein
MKVHEKLDKIKSDIQGRLGSGDGLPKGYKLQGELDHLDIDVLLELLLHAAVAASQQDQGKNKNIHIPAQIIKKLKEHMEAEEKDKTLEKEEVAKHMGLEEGEEAVGKNMEEEEEDEEEEEEDEEEQEENTTRIHLDGAQYAHILWNLFPKSMSSSSRSLQAQDRSLVGKQATKSTTATLLGEDEIKQMIHDAKKDILRELQEGKYDKGEGTGESAVPDQNSETSEKIDQMIDDMKQEFKEQLKIKGLVEEIKKNLNDHRWKLNKKECTLFILKVDELMDVSPST